MGYVFEQFKVGEKWVTGGRTITEADMVSFCGLMGDYHALHTDEEWCKRNSPFGTRVVHGPLVLILALGAMVRLGFLEDTALAALGLKQINYRAPVKPGDTITTTVEVLSARPTKKPGRGIVEMGLMVTNQHGTTVLEGTYALMLKAHDFVAAAV